MNTRSIADPNPDDETATPLVTMAGREVVITDGDGDHVNIDVTDITRLRAQLDAIDSQVEASIRTRVFTDGLRTLAGWLDQHPTVRVGSSLAVSVAAVDEQWTLDRDGIEHAAQIMGVPAAVDPDMSDATREYLQAELTFGPIVLRAGTYCEPVLRAVS